MFYDILKKHQENTLTELNIIDETLTMLSSNFYPYAVYLHNTNHTHEDKLIEAIRNRIFNIRDSYSRNEITKSDLIETLTNVFGLLEVQIVMLNGNSERCWEVSMISGNRDSLLAFTNILIKNNKQDEQRKLNEILQKELIDKVKS